MTEVEPSKYGGIALEPHDIDYDDIDPPLRRLIRLISSQPWIRTYGCCAGHAHHGEEATERHQFFIGLFVDDGAVGSSLLRSWLDKANRLNGPTGLRAEIDSVHKHPFGQGSVDGWLAYKVVVQRVGGRTITSLSQAQTRMVRCLETAWEEVFETKKN